MEPLENEAEPGQPVTPRLRAWSIVAATAIAYAGLMLIGQLGGRVLLPKLVRSGAGTALYGPIVWSLGVILILGVQAVVHWASGARGVSALALRTLASGLIAAVLISVTLLPFYVFTGDVTYDSGVWPLYRALVVPLAALEVVAAAAVVAIVRRPAHRTSAST